MRIEVDRSRCEGLGMCEAMAHELFEVGDDGFVVVHDDIEDDDDVAALHERIKVAERQMLVDNVGRLAREGFRITDRKVRFGL